MYQGSEYICTLLSSVNSRLSKSDLARNRPLGACVVCRKWDVVCEGLSEVRQLVDKLRFVVVDILDRKLVQSCPTTFFSCKLTVIESKAQQA